MSGSGVAEHRTIVLVDVEGFGDPIRTLPDQRAVRDGMYRVVREAFEAARVPWDRCYWEDRGDSVFVLVPADIPKAPFVEIVPDALTRELHEHNVKSLPQQQIRLRMAVHAGEVAFDDHGVTATSVTTAFRLLDAQQLKTALAASAGNLAMIVSEWIFDEVVRHSAVIDPARFRRMPVVVKETSLTAWISVPDHPYPSDIAALVRQAEDASWQAHWLPRARGSERQSDTGAWYFTGRVAARQRVCDWLADPSQPALVVTGGPGTGKSALLAHLLVASHPAWADTVPTAGPRPPVGSFDLAVHVSGLSCEDVVQRVAGAVGLDTTSSPELLAALRQRRQTGQPPVVIVADAVEEATSIDEARRIAVLLRNLAGTGTARILAGVRTAPAGTQRAAILGAFGVTIPHLSLESREFQRNDDVVDYVHNRLTHDDIRGHYRSQSLAALRKVSRAIARKASYNFLIAQLTTLWLTQATTPQLDLARTGWEQRLPETVGEAMEEYVQHCDADASLVRRILTALAFARGSGLSVGRTWLVMSDALHPANIHTLADLETVFHSAAYYLLERTDDRRDQPTYRLYHHALDEHLRDYCTQYTPQRYPLRAITCGLLDAIPRSEYDGRDWAAADAYTRIHLAGHAAQAHQLDDVLSDPGFLVYAEPGPLLDALAQTRTEQGQLTAAVYRLSERRHRHAQPLDRCRILALDAARLGARELRHDLNTFQNHLMRTD